MLEEQKKEYDDRFTKLTEILELNGQHLSFFNKNLEEVKMIMTDHIKRVEPMLLSYETDKQFNELLNKKTKKWGVRIGLVASAIGSFYVIKQFIVSIIMK